MPIITSLSAPAATLPSSLPASDQPDSLLGERCPLRILVAEDHYISQRLLCMLLKMLGYGATYVNNGRECLEAVMENSYDLILTDVDMPEMDGVECTRCLRRAGMDLPIIAVTASRLHDRDYYLEVGMNGYITMPLDLPQLQGTLQRVFQQKKAESPTYLQMLENGFLSMPAAQV